LFTSMCTTRSDMVLASLFSSIILSSPRALDPRFSTGLRELLEFESDDECASDDEWAEPSRLGVGVAKRERGSGGRAFVLGVGATELTGALPAAAAAVALVPDLGVADYLIEGDDWPAVHNK
jgi:hypothetical protein